MIMSSVARVKFIKAKVILGILPKASQIKFEQILITKSKFVYVQIPVLKWEKTKKWKKFFWFTKWDNKGITNRGKRDYK